MKIDFRYAPSFWQSTYCFPDDPHKSLVGKNGELLYGHGGIGVALEVFSHVVSIKLQHAGEGTFVRQKIESSTVPIITTEIAYKDITLQLRSFATNNPEEGRVDNLLVEIRSKSIHPVECSPVIFIKSQDKLWSEAIKTSFSSRNQAGVIRFDNHEGRLFMVIDSPLESDLISPFYVPSSGLVSKERSLVYFARFPQDGQSLEKVLSGLAVPEKLLDGTRNFWKSWNATEGDVLWRLGREHQEFLTASARNIEQAREIKNGKKIFQVGTTIYRGLWVVDGNFLLEAARYLGYDKEAQEGLESMWSLQGGDGGIFAGAGEAHWKDTAAAMFALVRQAELAQDWSYLSAMWSHVQNAVTYLKNLRDKARNDGTANGKYGLIPRGFGDSGLSGIRSEFTNTLWTLIGLKAILEAGRRLSLPELSVMDNFYQELHGSFLAAVAEELHQHQRGFHFLPMLMKEDPQWQERDELRRPRPQAAQVYMSHAIYPGFLFTKEDPLTKGHIEHMKAVTMEEIPMETGWLFDRAVWTYNAPIVAQVYLWAGMKELARTTFNGFLNHASPLLAWREEQSLRGIEPERFVGDMPHNWASAECIRFLRHMFILEGQSELRLFEGLIPEDAESAKQYVLNCSPTKWGRVSILLEPIEKKKWRAVYKREPGDEKFSPPLSAVVCPRELFGSFHFKTITGAQGNERDNCIYINPEEKTWEIVWHI